MFVCVLNHMMISHVSGCLDEDCLIDRSSMLCCVLNHMVISPVSGCLDEDLQ